MFTTNTPAQLTLSFRYNLDQGSDYESGELSQMLASFDGTLVGTAPGDFVAEVVGNGNGGPSIGTGWRLFQCRSALSDQVRTR